MLTAHMTSETNTQTVCIAVLPFENLSDDGEYDYFSRGFAEDLITDLSHFHSMQVISSYTTRKIAAKGDDAIEVYRGLAIDYLLGGNLSRRGDQIRLYIQLLDTANGGILWAERYDTPTSTIFDIQDEIVERVVGALSARVEPTRGS